MSSAFDPTSIELESMAKSFEYERMSRELDECDDVEEFRNACKCFIKLYLRTQETLKLFEP